MKCFIVLPCFNEDQNIKTLIHSLDQILKPQIPYRIVAVNDGSKDRTGDVLKSLSAEYPIRILEHPINLGLGAALRTGLIAAAEETLADDFVVTMDSDNTHNPKHILDMLIAGKDVDVVVGSRYVKGGRQLNVPPHRMLLSWLINKMIKTAFRLPSKDNTSGLRCFRAQILKRLHHNFQTDLVESRGFVASFELLLKAVRTGGTVVEVPIVLDYGKKNGVSKMRLFSTVLAYLTFLVRSGRLNGLKHSV